jgi:hypothetical protein
MSDAAVAAGQPSRGAPDSAYIAALWEHPDLCFALFGIQFLTAEGKALYDASGIGEELRASLQHATGLLCSRFLMEPNSGVIVQYWRNYDNLHAWARIVPHTSWWKWLVENRGKGVGFYHEIYTLRGAEAIYEQGTQPVGPATFCSIEPVRSGEGRSRQRMEQYAAARGRGSEARA